MVPLSTSTVNDAGGTRAGVRYMYRWGGLAGERAKGEVVKGRGTGEARRSGVERLKVETTVVAVLVQEA